jgi:SAM-dependent methyltransferase
VSYRLHARSIRAHSQSTMNEERRTLRARTFDEVAELYDRARRGYPEQLFDDLFALAGMSPETSSVLEVGCGTGQATRPLAERGCRVVCVELGPNLARIARRNMAEFPRVTVVNERFEDFDPVGATFDMVFAATAWHWIDPQLRYAKAASVLRPGGVLAFTSGAHAFPPGFDPFFTEIQKAYDAIGQSWQGGWPPPPPEQVPDLSEEIERSGYFKDIRVARHVWTTDFTAEEHVALMSTASDHQLMESAKREWLFSEMRRLHSARPGGIVRKHELTILHVASPRPV